MDNTFKSGAHPLMILRFMRRMILVLLIPVLRGLLNYGLSGTLNTLLIWETLLVVLIISLSTIRWLRYRISTDDEFLYINSGVLFTRSAQVSLNRITCIYIERHPLISVFGAVKVSIDTDAGGIKDSDFTFYLSSKKLESLCTGLHTITPKNHIYLCSTGQIVLMSLSNASALSGLLIAATIINNIGKIIGDVLEKRLLETLDLLTALTSKIIPPAATAIASVLALGFCVSFTMTLFKHLTFIVRCNTKGILIEQGLIWHKKSFITRESIGAAVVTMPPLLHLFRRCSLKIVASGYGKNNGENSVLFPIEKASDAGRSMHILGISENGDRELTLKIPKRAILRAIFMPITWLIVIVLCAIFGALLFESIRQIILILCIFIGVIDIYWLHMKIYHTHHGGASLTDGIRIYGFKGITLNNVFFSETAVDHIRISEGPYDRMNKMCTMQVTMRGEQGFSARTTNLDRDETDAEIEKIYGV